MHTHDSILADAPERALPNPPRTAPSLPGFLHVDVDGLWAVRACYAKDENGTFENDPCWTEGVPALEQVFSRVGVPAAFFIVGRDLELDSKRRTARKLLHRGYELANHSYTHRLGLTMEPVGFIHQELAQTDRRLRQLGAQPVGFRSPGYDVDARVLRVVRRLGYLYDASMLPTYLSPLLRVADAVLSRRWQPGKRQFGRVAYGRSPRIPYIPRLHKVRKPALRREPDALLEIPVGTTPTLHLPLTASSLFPLSRRRLQDLFGRLAERRQPTLLLLHAIDGVDCARPIIFDNRRPSLGGFSLSADEKQRRLQRIVEEFARQFDVVRTDDYARAFLQS